MKFYIAGPMRGYDCFNFNAFDEAASYLTKIDIEPASPAQMDRDEFGWGECPEQNVLEGFDVEDALRRDFLAILEADGVLLLPGWSKSTGAKAEKFVAETTGKEILYYWPKGKGYRLRPQPLPQDLPTFEDHCTIGRTEDNQPGEVRIVDPKTGGAKGQKLARFDLLPWDALWVVAEHYGRGALKYEERNWERGYAWSLSHAALHRHLAALWNGEDIDEETGGPHAAAIVFHALAFLSFYLRGIGTDDRPQLREAA